MDLPKLPRRAQDPALGDPVARLDGVAHLNAGRPLPHPQPQDHAGLIGKDVAGLLLRDGPGRLLPLPDLDQCLGTAEIDRKVRKLVTASDHMVSQLPHGEAGPSGPGFQPGLLQKLEDLPLRGLPAAIHPDGPDAAREPEHRRRRQSRPQHQHPPSRELFGGKGQPAPAQDPDTAGGPESAAAQGEKISRGDPGLKQVRIQRLHPSKDYALPGAQRKKALSRGASDLNEQAPPQILFPSHSVRSRY